MVNLSWRPYGDGRPVGPGDVVAPDERLSWPRTIGIGVQHVLAMFGATFLVPLLTGFPPATTLFFSGLGTLLFLVITGNRLPSYLGSSLRVHRAGHRRDGERAARGRRARRHRGRRPAARGRRRRRCTFAGTRWIEFLMPPVVTGDDRRAHRPQPGAHVVGQLSSSQPVHGARHAGRDRRCACVLFRGLLGRLSILARRRRRVRSSRCSSQDRGRLRRASRGAAWVGLPDFTAPRVRARRRDRCCSLPVVLVLIAENVGPRQGGRVDDRPRRSTT